MMSKTSKRLLNSSGTDNATRNTLMQTLIALGALLLALGAAIYLGIRRLSFRFGNTRVSEFLLWTSCASALCFIPWADLIDAAALIVYAGAVVGARLLVLKRPLRASEIALHLTILYLSLSRLDKVTGYGHSSELLVVARYLFLVTLASSCIHLAFKPGKSFAIAALLLLIFPASHFPLELSRNILARHMTPTVKNLYVTKLFSEDIYGLRFNNHHWVEHHALREGRFQMLSAHLLNDGGGTLDAQIPLNAPWEFHIIQAIFDNPHAERQPDLSQ